MQTNRKRLSEPCHDCGKMYGKRYQHKDKHYCGECYPYKGLKGVYNAEKRKKI